MKLHLNAAGKLALTYIFTLAVLIFGWSVYGTHFFENKLKVQTQTDFYNALAGISDNYIKGYYNNMLVNADLQTEIKIISKYLNARILTARDDGTMLFDTDQTYLFNLNTYDTDILSETYCYDVTLPGYIDQPFMSVSYPITYNMKMRGYLVMIKYTEDIRRSADELNSSYWPFVAGMAALISAIFLMLYFQFVQPLKRLVRVAKEYSNRNYSYTCDINTGDEYTELYSALRCIGDDFHNLEKQQHKFISNVSHDFRSPLTSIKGYTEAMIDGTIPPEMCEKYLKIIMFETERLTKLTSNLLDLSRIDSKGTILDITPFDINATIKQTVACFEGVCTEKQITVKLFFEEPKTFVLADLSKIQQVLYNLIDNAIKFSYNDSTLVISSKIKGDKIFVSVKDSGIGIPKDSLNKIWDRFYKTDQSRGKDKKGTGLGLSIVKEIINTHGENITATSTLDVGTEFSFSLPRKL